MEIFKVITAAGGLGVVSILTAGSISYLLSKHKIYKAFFLGFVVLATEVSVILIKYTVAIPRPPELLRLVSAYGFSFPSAHAAVSVALYGSICYLVAKKLSNIYAKIGLILITVVIIGLIAESRLILGVHYVSDIIAGLAIGAIWLTLGVVLLETKQ